MVSPKSRFLDDLSNFVSDDHHSSGSRSQVLQLLRDDEMSILSNVSFAETCSMSSRFFSNTGAAIPESVCVMGKDDEGDDPLLRMSVVLPNKCTCDVTKGIDCGWCIAKEHKRKDQLTVFPFVSDAINKVLGAVDVSPEVQTFEYILDLFIGSIYRCESPGEDTPQNLDFYKYFQPCFLGFLQELAEESSTHAFVCADAHQCFLPISLTNKGVSYRQYHGRRRNMYRNFGRASENMAAYIKTTNKPRQCKVTGLKLETGDAVRKTGKWLVHSSVCSHNLLFELIFWSIIDYAATSGWDVTNSRCIEKGFDRLPQDCICRMLMTSTREQSADLLLFLHFLFCSSSTSSQMEESRRTMVRCLEMEQDGASVYRQMDVAQLLRTQEFEEFKVGCTTELATAAVNVSPKKYLHFADDLGELDVVYCAAIA